MILPKPLVTIVIPCHQKAQTIIRAIDSIKVQSLNNLEVFIILDRCTDDSLSLVKEAITNDRRFKYFEVDFGNVADTRNYGISQGDAPFICCLDGDDWLEPEFLERCVKPLLDDRSLGITFTGLMSHFEDGHKTQSPWPAGFDYNAQLQKKNQVPTCCVFRRVAWERTGGYRSRYCGEGGAGSEDAALWTAIGSIGFKAQQVTKKPLFNYSMQGGLVHDNKGYREPDWLCMYPWVKDELHPFASIARPKNHSHPVRQYDEPKISVIIPVGPGHEKEVGNALDSLEMQHFRQWEAIVVWDSDKDISKGLWQAYPYVKFLDTGSFYSEYKNDKGELILQERVGGGQFGAGYARNQGVKNARSPLILFLDADDIFNDPHALDKMIAAWNKEKSIIYSDYLGKASWDYEEAVKKFGPIGTGRLLGWLNKTKQAIIRHYAADYDCNLAQQQPKHNPNNPNMPYFHWALVSCLIPKIWHDAIDGFDESMETWEDVDYHWRLARAGYCFHRIEEPLFLYNYDGGHRRVSSSVTDKNSRQKHKKMIKYLTGKYKGTKITMCNCNKNTAESPFSNPTGAMAGPGAVSDNEMVLIEFTPNYTGNRSVVGTAYKGPGNRPIDYGYGRRKGDKFYVHKLDQQAQPHLFQIVSETIPHVETIEDTKSELPPPATLVEGPPEPEYTPIDEETELKMIEGMYGNYTAKDMVTLIEDQETKFDVDTLNQLLTWARNKKGKKTVVKAINKILKSDEGLPEETVQEK